MRQASCLMPLILLALMTRPAVAALGAFELAGQPANIGFAVQRDFDIAPLDVWVPGHNLPVDGRSNGSLWRALAVLVQHMACHLLPPSCTSAGQNS